MFILSVCFIGIYVGGKQYKALDDGLSDCHNVEVRRLDESDVTLIRAIVSKYECIVYIIQDSGSDPSPFIKELESLPADENHRKNVFLILFKSEEQDTIKRSYHYVLKRQEDPSSDASSCAKMVVDEVERIRRQEEAADFPDGEKNVLEDFKEVMKTEFTKLGAQMGEGFDKVGKKLGEATKTLQEDIEVLHDEVIHQNGQANGNVTVTDPCTAT